MDRSTKPSLLTSNGLSLRDIILPTKLMHNFLTLAFSNTTSNKETCGILAGRLERNKLMVTHLLIPEQTGTPDSCTTHNEEDIFDYQDQHNLITLGWIHVCKIYFVCSFITLLKNCKKIYLFIFNLFILNIYNCVMYYIL